MEWIDGMNKAIEYLEDNLADEIDLEMAAKMAICSSFHFQRVFAYITGVTLNEYIRRRRMTVAAFELLEGDAKVIDLAYKYGYESPTAFNRAFRNIHGVSPSKAKIEGIGLTAFPRITFTFSVKGEEAMNYKIEKKEPFRVVGYVTKEDMTMEDCFEKVPQFWQSVIKQGGIEKLCALMQGKDPHGILGISLCEGGNFSGYLIAVATDAPVPAGMEEYTIPEMTYALFEAIGAMPSAIQNLQQRIISEWLPTSGYEYGPAPDIEVYPEGDQQSATYRSEVWLPIVKK
ncbi:MAG: AraC family transcriptional regulator [Methanocorpusculum sp.]|nr:AraC family transcriptional regulator [Methanocorpusculum sp.]